MSMNNQNIIEQGIVDEDSEMKFLKELKQHLKETHEKWRNEKPFYNATVMIIETFWKYILSLVDPEYISELSYQIHPSENLEEKLLNEKSNINAKLDNIIDGKKKFIKRILQMESSFNENDFNKKIKFYLEEFYIKEMIDDDLVKRITGIKEETCKNFRFESFLIEIVENYIHKKISSIESYNNNEGFYFLKSFKPNVPETLTKILSNINSSREKLKYQKYDEKTQLEINSILFLFKLYKKLKRKILGFSPERDNIRMLNLSIIKKNEGNNTNNYLANLVDNCFHNNDKEISKRLFQFNIENNKFSLYKILRHSVEEDDAYNILKKEVYQNIVKIEEQILPILKEILIDNIHIINNSSNKNNHNPQFVENFSIVAFIRVCRIMIILEALEKDPLNVEKWFDKLTEYSKTYWIFSKWQDNDQSNMESFSKVLELENFRADSDHILEKIISVLEKKMRSYVYKLPNPHIENISFTDLNQTVIFINNIFPNEVVVSVFLDNSVFYVDDDRRNIQKFLYSHNEENGYDEITLEKFKFDNKPEGSFIRLLTEIIYMLKNKNIKLTASDNRHLQKTLNYLFSDLNEKFQQQIKANNEIKRLIEKAGENLNVQNYESFLFNLTKLLEICEPININYLLYLISKTEEAAAKIKEKKIVLLMGKTGCGKSTLTLFFSGIKLIKDENNELVPEHRNYDNQELLKVIPKSGFLSETRFLTPIENSSEKLENPDFTRFNPTYFICDSPGLEDTRDEESEISNIIGLLKGIKVCKSVRVVFITTHQFGDRFEGLIDLVKNIRRMLNNPMHIIPKFVFLVNKCSEQEFKELKKKIKNFSVNLSENLNFKDHDEEFFALIKKFSKNFVEKVKRIDPLEDDFKEILNEDIFEDETFFLKQLSSIFKITYSDKTHNKINEFIQSSKDAILNAVRSIQDGCSTWNENEFDKNLKFEISLIFYYVSQLDYFQRKIEREDSKEKINEIIYELENFLETNFNYEKSILEKSLKTENQLTSKELNNYNQKYKINKEFRAKLKGFLSKDCINDEAYINNIDYHFRELIENISLDSENEIKKTNKIFNKTKVILENHPEKGCLNFFQFYLNKEFAKGFDDKIIKEILKYDKNSETIFEEQSYDLLFRMMIRFNFVITLLDNKNSGFNFAMKFHREFFGNDICNELEEEGIEKNKEFKREEFINIINKNRNFFFIISKIIDLKKDVLNRFISQNEKLGDENIQFLIDTIKTFQKLIENNQIHKLGDTFNEVNQAIEEIGNRLESYLNSLKEMIITILDGRANNNENNFSNNSNFRVKKKSQITNVFLDIQELFNIILKIEGIEALSKFTTKPIMESRKLLDDFLFQFDKNVYEISENIKNDFISVYHLKIKIERLRGDFVLISESPILKNHKIRFIEDLKLNFANSILEFLEEKDFYGVPNLEDKILKNHIECSTSIKAINSFNLLLRLKEIFPEFSKLKDTIDSFNKLCEKILMDLKNCFSEESLNRNLKKQKLKDSLNLCEIFKQLSSDNEYHLKFSKAKDLIKNYLKKYEEKFNKTMDFFFKELSTFNLENYHGDQQIEELTKNADTWYGALKEFKNIKEKYSDIFENIFEEDDFESFMDKIFMLLKEKIAGSISKDLKQGTNIKHENLDTIPKIIEIFEKFEFIYDKTDIFRDLKDKHSNLLKDIIPNEKRSEMTKIDEKRYLEILKYFDNIYQENSQETKKIIYRELRSYLSENLQKLLQVNENILKKLKNSDYESCDIHLIEISNHLKAFKEIKDIKDKAEISLNNHIDEKITKKIQQQYENSLKELSDVFNYLLNNIKSDIENYNFRSYLDKKEFFSKHLNEFSDFIENGTPLDKPFINEINQLFESKVKEIINLYKETFENFSRIPPKDLFINLKYKLKNEYDRIYSVIEKNLNDYVSSNSNGNITETENKIKRLNIYLKFLPEDLKTKFESKTQDKLNWLAREKKEKEDLLDQYMNNKQHEELIKFSKEIINFDTNGIKRRELKKFINEEMWRAEHKVIESYSKGNYEEMYSNIKNFDLYMKTYKDTFSECTQPIFNELKKFLLMELTKNNKLLISTFIEEKAEFSDLEFILSLSDQCSDRSIEKLVTNSDRFGYDEKFSSQILLLVQTLFFRKEERELFQIYVENNTELTFLNVFEITTDAIQENIILFDNSISNNILDFNNLSNSYLNILRWKNKINLMKNKLLSERADYLNNKLKTTKIEENNFYFNRDLFFDKDMENDKISKFLLILKAFDAESYRKRLDDIVNNLKSEIINSNLFQQPRKLINNHGGDVFESMLLKLEILIKLIDKKFCENKLFTEIQDNLTKNIQESVSKMKEIIKKIIPENFFIKEKDWIVLSDIYRNLKHFLNVNGEILINKKIELKIDTHIHEIEKMLESLLDKVIDYYSDSFEKSKLDKISELLTSLKKYSNHFPFMKENINLKIEEFLQRIRNAKKEHMSIQKLGQLLDSDKIGKDIMEEHKIFDDYLDVIYSNLLKSFGVEKVLDKLKAENIKFNNQNKIIGQNLLLDKIPLRDFYKSYNKHYNDYLRKNLNFTRDKKFEELLDSLSMKIHFKRNHKPGKTMWSFDMVSSIPEILAIISVIWTLTYSNNYFQMSMNDRDDQFLKMPNANQIIAIFCLLCIDTKKIEILNNLVEIEIGEGKSIVLALTAALLSLYGFNVNILHYNSYLSRRDFKEYLPFFHILGVSEYIFYGDFKSIGQKILNQKGDIREITKSLIFSDNNLNYDINIKVEDNYKNIFSKENKDRKIIAHENNSQPGPIIDNPYQEASGDEEDQDYYISCYRPNVLLLKEVDVLFQKDFNENQFIPCFTYKHEKINALFDFIWKKHIKLLENRKEKNQFFEYEEKQYLELEVDILDSKVFENCQKLFTSCPELLKETIRNILFDLSVFKSLPIYQIENDKIVFKDQDRYSNNNQYRYKTVFAYYEEWSKKRVSEASFKENIFFIFYCGHFSYPDIFKRFYHVIGVSGTLSHLTDIEKEFIGEQFKIQRYVFMPSVIEDKASRMKFQYDNDHIYIAENKHLHSQVIADKLRKLFYPDSHLETLEANQKETPEIEKSKRCAIIFFENFYDLQDFEISYHFNALNYPYRVLTERTLKQDVEGIVRQACKAGSITMATRSFGRSIDFVVRDHAVKAAGGLLVIQAFLSEEKSEEVQIKACTTRIGGTGTFNLILKNDQLESMKIPSIPKALVKDHIDTLSLSIDSQRRKNNEEKLQVFMNNLNHKIENFKKSEEFLDMLKNGDTMKVKNYIIKMNKGFGKYVCRTKIYVDATLGMDSLIKKTKEVINNIFMRTSKILNNNNLHDTLILFQIGAYKNYTCREELILECSPWESQPDNLINFLNLFVECHGMGEKKALEVAFWDVLKTQPNVAQAIIIGQGEAHSQKEIENSRKDFLSFRGDYANPADYWIKSKYSNIGTCESMLTDIKERNIKLHAFYAINEHNSSLKEKEIVSFERFAHETKGTFKNINIQSKTSGEDLTRSIVLEILKDIAQNSELKDLEVKLIEEHDRLYC